MAIINMHMKFEIEIPKQTWLMLRKPLKFGVDIQSQIKVSPETKKSNMATRWSFWK